MLLYFGVLVDVIVADVVVFIAVGVFDVGAISEAGCGSVGVGGYRRRLPGCIFPTPLHRRRPQHDFSIRLPAGAGHCGGRRHHRR